MVQRIGESGAQGRAERETVERVGIPVNEILVGDAAEQLRQLPAQSVHCVVTSPPYWGLRDYGVQGQHGLETTPQEYLDRMVATFRAVRRVLRRDGTLWLNMGDCYATGAGRIGNHPGGGEQGARWRGDVDRNRDEKRRSTRDGSHCGKHTAIAALGPMNQPKRMPIPGLKPKDLVGMPWRLALALQADGWWLRQDNIWAKRNVMPESVRDRTTRSHEYVFQLTRAEHYFYDSFAIEEPQSDHERTRRLKEQSEGLDTIYHLKRHDQLDFKQTKPGRSGAVKTVAARHNLAMKGTRNKRSVWFIGTQPFKDAHFATFPEKLIEPCILAGTSERGCCSLCGTPRVRTVTPTAEYAALLNANLGNNHLKTRAQDMIDGRGGNGIASHGNVGRSYRTTGWTPGCSCGLGGIVPCTVLDPFMGAGTTALVSLKLGRRFIGIELKPEYAQLARRRIAPLLLTTEGGGRPRKHERRCVR